MATPGDVVLPGDVIVVNNSSSIILGPGLRHENGVVYASIAGVLKHSSQCKYWIENRQKKYIQSKGDRVVGVVLSEMGENYKVDIGTNYYATINYLSFEGATKTNRPDIKVGDILYGRLLLGEVYMEPELVCIDSQQNSCGMGVLNGGHLLRMPSYFARKLLSPGNKTLKQLGRMGSFEVTVGVNGWIWVKGSTTRDIMKITQAFNTLLKQPNDNINNILSNIHL